MRVVLYGDDLDPLEKRVSALEIELKKLLAAVSKIGWPPSPYPTKKRSKARKPKKALGHDKLKKDSVVSAHAHLFEGNKK